MKGLRYISVLFSAVLLSILFYSCSRVEAEDDQLSGKISVLEVKVDSLQKRLNDQTLKTMVASSLLFKSPLEKFFQSPEFWENTYDSGQADCSRRCIQELQTTRAECEKKEDENERLQCFQEATNRAATCHKQYANLCVT